MNATKGSQQRCGHAVTQRHVMKICYIFINDHLSDQHIWANINGSELLAASILFKYHGIRLVLTCDVYYTRRTQNKT